MDKKIKFDKTDFYKEEVKNRQKTKILMSPLSYMPEACYHCNTQFGTNIIKHGSKNGNIAMNDIMCHKTILRLKKQKYYCKNCGKTFTLETEEVAKLCHISRSIGDCY
ncbi:MAG: transposase family protein [Lachnospirales bacterium]